MEATRPAARGRAPGHAGPPMPGTRFVGRQRELQQLSHQLLHSRLLTLTGPGGIGKTRLALEVTRDWPSIRGEVTVCELAGVREPERVDQALAESPEIIEAVALRAELGTRSSQTIREQIPDFSTPSNMREWLHNCN